MNEENKVPETGPNPELPKKEDVTPPESSGETSKAPTPSEPPSPAEKPKPIPPKPAAPPKPTSPVDKRAMDTVKQKSSAPAGEPMTRRSFMKVMTIGWLAFAAAVGGVGTMIMRFMFPNVLFEPKQSFKAGTPDDYSIGEVSLKWKGKHGVWLVRDEEKMYALSTVCTHLGCTPNWLENEAKFKCPCHGSGFYATGINFEGPAPRPLERYKISIADDGKILVDKTKKFQQEKGEWNDPESFILV